MALLNYPVITSGEYRHQGSFNNLLGTDQAALAKLSVDRK